MVINGAGRHRRPPGLSITSAIAARPRETVASLLSEIRGGHSAVIVRYGRVSETPGRFALLAARMLIGAVHPPKT